MDTDNISFEPKRIKSSGKEKAEMCVCPNCGYKTQKRMGVPCSSMKCPVCNENMIAR